MELVCKQHICLPGTANYCVMCVQYQLLFPTLQSVVEQISETKVNFFTSLLLNRWQTGFIAVS